MHLIHREAVISSSVTLPNTVERVGEIPAPLTSSFFTDNKTLLVCSHPGWSRRYEREQTLLAKTIKTSPIISALREKNTLGEETFEILYAPKIAAIIAGYSRLLYEEVCSEEALFRAVQRGIPSVVSVPSERKEGRLVVSEGAQCFLSSYLKALFSDLYALKKDASLWVLPTGPSCGTVFGAPYAQDDPWGEKTFTALEDAHVGRFITPLVSSDTRKVLFAGGYLDGCLLSTLTYFLPHGHDSLLKVYRSIVRRELVIDDRFTVSQFQFGTDPSGKNVKEQPIENFALETSLARELLFLLKDGITGKKPQGQVRSKIIELFISNFGRDTTNNWSRFSGWEDHILLSQNHGITHESLMMLPPLVRPDGIELGPLLPYPDSEKTVVADPFLIESSP